jgi:hypothetical protein
MYDGSSPNGRNQSAKAREVILTLTRFWGVEEEKFGTMDTGGFNGQISTNLYERIQTASGKII